MQNFNLFYKFVILLLYKPQNRKDTQPPPPFVLVCGNAYRHRGGAKYLSNY